LYPFAVVGDVGDAANGEEATGSRSGGCCAIESERENRGYGRVFEAVMRGSVIALR
jgi:hypothetical protein